MKIKGTALVTTMAFVLEEYGSDAREAWLQSLDEEVEYSLRYPLASSWYSVERSYLEPGIQACRMFSDNDLVGAVRQWGVYGAIRELTGLYRILLRVGSPSLMIAAASKTWRTFYSEGALETVSNTKGSASIRTKDVPIRNPLWGEVTAGWMEQAAKMTGAKDSVVTVAHVPDDRNDFFQFDLSW